MSSIPAVRLCVALISLTAITSVAACNDKLQATCTADSQCAKGQICNLAVTGGVCGLPCNSYNLEAPAAGEPSEAESFCRTQLGSDPEDESAVKWACGEQTGQCFRQNACLADGDCGNGLVCHTSINGASVLETQLFTCLPTCSANPEEICPSGTTCDAATDKCVRGCEQDASLCTGEQVCQANVSTPAMCAPRCDVDFDCSAQGEYRCDTASGLCVSGCDNDQACPEGKVCMLTGEANPAKPNKCYKPCPGTGCNLFNSREPGGATFMCDDTGHCIPEVP